MSLSGIAQFLIGFTIGVALLVGGGVGAGYYFWTKLSTVPSRPTFSEEKPKPSPTAKKEGSTTASNSQSKPSTPIKLPTKELPPGAYKARINWAEGLILRDASGADAARIGGVAFKQEVFVLQESDDQKWQKVRVADGDQEGWIKAGNIERINE